MTSSPETLALLLKRRSSKVLTLQEPGPSPKELETILTAATRVPDHGKLAPWRFLLFRNDARPAFGEILRRRFLETRPDASDDMADIEARRFLRAPLVVAVISRVTPGIKIPEWEQQLSAGAVCQNMLIAATALGYGCCWLTEWCAYDEVVARALKLVPGERVAGFVYLGTPLFANAERPRPALEGLCRDWTPAG